MRRWAIPGVPFKFVSCTHLWLSLLWRTGRMVVLLSVALGPEAVAELCGLRSESSPLCVTVLQVGLLYARSGAYARG